MVEQQRGASWSVKRNCDQSTCLIGARHSLRVSGAADNLILGRKNPIKCPNSAQPVECPVCAKFNKVSGLRNAKVSRNFALLRTSPLPESISGHQFAPAKSREISRAKFRARNRACEIARNFACEIARNFAWRKLDTSLNFAQTGHSTGSRRIRTLYWVSRGHFDSYPQDTTARDTLRECLVP